MKSSSARRVGFFTLITLILLALIISWKSNIFLISQGYELTGSFKNIEGLTVGSEVRYRGFNIGKVMRIDPNPRDIRVYSTIKKGLIIPEDSKLRVGFDGLVGQKYLEVTPGTSEIAYQSGQVIFGVSTAGIVDFVDIGAQNLVETKKILLTFRSIIEDNKLQEAFKNAVFTADKVTVDIEKLAQELRATNSGIMKITTDPEFQSSVKGMTKETNKTLTSANKFFDSF